MNDIVKKVEEAITDLDTKVVDFISTSNATIHDQGKLTADQAEQMASLESEIKDVKASMLDIEQEIAGSNGFGSQQESSLGQQVVDSDGFKSFASGSSGKATITVQANTITGSDTIVAPDRRDGIIDGASRSLRVSDVLPQLTTTVQSVEITRENVFTNSAAETAEAAEKPESAVTYEQVTTPIRTIAHWLKVSRQVMEDAPMIVSHINTRLVYGVNFRVDAQLLAGDGIAPNISGMMTAGNLTAFTPSGTDPIVSIREAITDVEQADYAATAVILNPADVQTIDLTTSTDGIYVAANPRAGQAPVIWGIPIVVSNAQTAGQFIVAAFPVYAAQINRSDVVVTLSDSDDDNFTKNLVTILAERRVGLGIWRPASAVGGALST